MHLALAFWQDLERALATGDPLPDDLRMALFQLAFFINDLSDDGGLPPKQAALEAAKLAGLTGQAVKEHRAERRERFFGDLFKNELSRINSGMKGELTGETKREGVADKLGKMTGRGRHGRHRRTIERWAKRQRP